MAAFQVATEGLCAWSYAQRLTASRKTTRPDLLKLQRGDIRCSTPGGITKTTQRVSQPGSSTQTYRLMSGDVLLLAIKTRRPRGIISFVACRDACGHEGD